MQGQNMLDLPTQCPEKLAAVPRRFPITEDQQFPIVARAHLKMLKQLGCLGFAAARHSGRAGNIAFFINEIQVLIIAIHGLVHHNLGFSIARFKFLANVAFLVQEVQVLRIIALQSKLFHFFRHGVLGFVKTIA
jgi:prepilin-type processing-associated H-X9-DG protein